VRTLARGQAPRPAALGSGAGGPARWRPGIPFSLVHLCCLAAPFVGWSPAALGTCAAMYLVRMFGITAFYHRCFSHRAFRVPRAVQLVGAFLGAAAAQRGPLWWAAHHRRHHHLTDRPGDPHSPRQDGLAYSHLFWMFAPANKPTDLGLVEDLARFPELRLIDRCHYAAPALVALATFALGTFAGHAWPSAGVNGPQLLVWGFFVSTVLVYQATFAVNSLGHRWGRRSFDTPDESRNIWWLALATLGEGWHNNHHRFCSSARSGFSAWQLDLTFWGIRLLERLGLASQLRPVPAHLVGRPRPPGSRR
jgi:stearoyl-CoA desaturase (delta-9 desaturase)